MLRIKPLINQWNPRLAGNPTYLLDDLLVPFLLKRVWLQLLSAGTGQVLVRLELIDGVGNVVWESAANYFGGRYSFAGAQPVRVVFDCSAPPSYPEGTGLVHGCIPADFIVLDNQRLRIVVDGATDDVDAIPPDPEVPEDMGTPAVVGTTPLGEIMLAIVVDE